MSVLRISSKFLTDDQMTVLLDKIRNDCERNIVTCRALEDCFTRENQPCNQTHWFFERRNMEYLLSELTGTSEEIQIKLNKWVPILEKKKFYERTPTPFTKTKAFWDSLPSTCAQPRV